MERGGERGRVRKRADEAGVRLQAHSGQRCGRRVKLSSHYHADTRADNGGSICSCQPLQIWCHPVCRRQRASASNQTVQAPPACKKQPSTSHSLTLWLGNAERAKAASRLPRVIHPPSHKVSIVYSSLRRNYTIKLKGKENQISTLHQISH